MVTATLDDATKQAVRYVRALPGVRDAPDYPPEELGNYPFALGYVGGGVWKFGPTGVKKGLHTIVVELHVARKDLSKDIKSAMVFSDSIPNLLMSKLLNDNKWNNTIDTFEQITYTFGSLGWNEVATIGFRFRVEGIKMESATT